MITLGDLYRATGRDATMLLHAGAIANARGDGGRTAPLMREALALDPAFSVVHAPVARRITRRS